MPCRNDPEIPSDLDRRKLRLGQPHPILVDQGCHLANLAARKKILRLQQAPGILRTGFGGKQCHHPTALPAIAGRGHAGLPKQCLFGIGLRIGVFNRNTERIQRIQRLAQNFDPVLRAHQAQFMHGFVPPIRTKGAVCAPFRLFRTWQSQRWRCDSHSSR